MSSLAPDTRRFPTRAITLVELVLVIVVSSLVLLVTPILLFHGVKTLVFLPKALAVNEAAGEVLHQAIEGGFSTLTGQPAVRGLRFAVRRSATEPALWLTQASSVGFLTSENQCVFIRLDGGVIKRSVSTSLPCATQCNPAPCATEEDIPYHVAGSVQITTAGNLFTYYNPGSGIRRVDIAFTAQTGGGNFDQGDAQEAIASSVAIRVP